MEEARILQAVAELEKWESRRERVRQRWAHEDVRPDPDVLPLDPEGGLDHLRPEERARIHGGDFSWASPEPQGQESHRSLASWPIV